MLMLLIVVILTVFLLVTTRSRAVYKRDSKTGKSKISYRSLAVITAIIAGSWYGIYFFFSKSTNNVVPDWEDDLGFD